MTEQEAAVAFSQGSDARIEGLYRDDCPYDLVEQERDFRFYWMMGWNDVDKHWGEDAKWPHIQIPKIKGRTALDWQNMYRTPYPYRNSQMKNGEQN